MITFYSVIMTVCVATLWISAIQLIRIHFLSRNLSKVLDDVFSQREAASLSGMRWSEIQQTIKYPDIAATYDNLKWYKPWERPSTLIVYDKD